jgi:hypothetical protein
MSLDTIMGCNKQQDLGTFERENSLAQYRRTQMCKDHLPQHTRDLMRLHWLRNELRIWDIGFVLVNLTLYWTGWISVIINASDKFIATKTASEVCILRLLTLV